MRARDARRIFNRTARWGGRWALRVWAVICVALLAAWAAAPKDRERPPGLRFEIGAGRAPRFLRVSASTHRDHLSVELRRYGAADSLPHPAGGFHCSIAVYSESASESAEFAELEASGRRWEPWHRRRGPALPPKWMEADLLAPSWAVAVPLALAPLAAMWLRRRARRDAPSAPAPPRWARWRRWRWRAIQRCMTAPPLLLLGLLVLWPVSYWEMLDLSGRARRQDAPAGPLPAAATVCSMGRGRDLSLVDGRLVIDTLWHIAWTDYPAGDMPDTRGNCWGAFVQPWTDASEAYPQTGMHHLMPLGVSFVRSESGVVKSPLGTGLMLWSPPDRTCDGSAYVVVRLWLPALVLAALSWPWARHWQQERTLRRRRQQGLCLYCGYDLRATPLRCPECGIVPEEKPASRDDATARRE